MSVFLCRWELNIALKSVNTVKVFSTYILKCDVLTSPGHWFYDWLKKKKSLQSNYHRKKPNFFQDAFVRIYVNGIISTIVLLVK